MSEVSEIAAPHVVIIGAGFAGLSAAKALRDAPVRVTVIDRSNHHLFQPLLYQVATAALSPADISAPIRAVLRGQANTEVLMAEVTGVDLDRREVLMRDQPDPLQRAVSYEYLVVATGATHSYFGHDEWAEFAPGLKSIEDATSIRRRILLAFEAAEMEPDLEAQRAYLTFVVVGGGPTGVEMAGAIAELARHALVSDFRHIDPASARVILVEALPRILTAYPESLSKAAHAQLERLGVKVWTQSPVEAVDADGVVIGGERLAAKTVIWGAGVRASAAGAWLGAATDRAGRVLVEPDLTLPGHPEVFVIGDTASVTEQKKQVPGVAPAAMQAGEYVAKVIRARADEAPAPGPFHYVNKGNLATIGRASGIAELPGGIRFSGFAAWFLWLSVHIYFLIGFRNRLLVLLQWAWAYLTYQRGARLITNGELAESRRLERPQPRQRKTA